MIRRGGHNDAFITARIFPALILLSFHILHPAFFAADILLRKIAILFGVSLRDKEPIRAKIH